MKKDLVLIEVSNGLAYVIKKPNGIIVQINDYDTEGCCFDDALCKKGAANRGGHYHKEIHK